MLVYSQISRLVSGLRVTSDQYQYLRNTVSGLATYLRHLIYYLVAIEFSL
jgi:hypothetical protein